MVGLISIAELRRMRAAATLMLPAACTIQVRSTATDGMGGITETWSNTYTNVPCKLDPVKSMNVLVRLGEQAQTHTPWVLSVDYGQAIGTGNRVVLNGDTFEVLNVEDAHSYRILRRAYVRRVE